MPQFEGSTHKITKAFVEGVPLSGRDKKGRVQQRFYWDSRDRGFGVCVGLNAKTFVVQREIDGRTVRETIGRFGPRDWAVDQARKEAQQRLSALARGERQPKALAITLKEAWERIALPYLRNKKRSETTITVYGYNIQKYLSDWLNRPLATITRTEARERHDKLAVDPGKQTADLVMKVFGAVYNRALTEHDLPVNPTVAVAFHKPEPPRSAIPAEKLPAWYAAVNGLDNAVHRDCLEFLLYSGLRKSSAFNVRWDDVDVEHRVLHVATTKGDEPFDLPMNSQMIEIVKRRLAERDLYAKPWLFPSATSATGHIEKLPVPKVADLEWVVHDLRRTFITRAVAVAGGTYRVKLIVNHKLPGDVTASYVKPAELQNELRADIQKIGDALAAAMESREAKVVPIRQRRVRA